MTVAAIAYAVAFVLLFVGAAQVVMVLQDRWQRRKRARFLRGTTEISRTVLDYRAPMTTPKEDLFRALCKAHDLTHVYADDHKAWKRGADQLVAIYEAAKELPRETAMRIWNEEVDRKLVAGAREDFYWTGP